MLNRYIVYLVIMIPLVAILVAQKPPAENGTPQAIATEIPDKIVANFWRAKSELSAAENNCRMSDPNYTTAKKRWDEVVVEIRQFCKGEGIFRPDGNPGCPPATVAGNPQTEATRPPTPPAQNPKAAPTPTATTPTAKK